MATFTTEQNKQLEIIAQIFENAGGFERVSINEWTYDEGDSTFVAVENFPYSIWIEEAVKVISKQAFMRGYAKGYNDFKNMC